PIREDALATITVGASTLGFNFYPTSPRYLHPQRAAQLIAELPGSAWKVGIFVNESPARIAEIAHRVGLDIVQLHGDQPAVDYPAGIRIWKAAQVDASFRLTQIEQYPAEAVLL